MGSHLSVGRQSAALLWRGGSREAVSTDQPGHLEKLRYGLLNALQRSCVFPGRVRSRIVRLLGHDLSPETFIAEQVFFSGRGLKTEGVVSINVGCQIDAEADIHIEDGVRIACRVMLLTTTHEVGIPRLRAGQLSRRSIRIGRGSWIGAGAIILPGVSIAPGCVVAAGAVVNKNTAPNGLYAGVPARRVKSLR